MKVGRDHEHGSTSWKSRGRRRRPRNPHYVIHTARGGIRVGRPGRNRQPTRGWRRQRISLLTPAAPGHHAAAPEHTVAAPHAQNCRGLHGTSAAAPRRARSTAALPAPAPASTLRSRQPPARPTAISVGRSRPFVLAQGFIVSCIALRKKFTCTFYDDTITEEYLD